MSYIHMIFAFYYGKINVISDYSKKNNKISIFSQKIFNSPFVNIENTILICYIYNLYSNFTYISKLVLCFKMNFTCILNLINEYIIHIH